MTVRLPARSKQTTTASVLQAETPSRSLRVLVVEDEPMPLKVLTELLEGEGHRVVTATDGREGLRKFQAGLFDVVMVDWAMPEMNGAELAVTV